jgi:hypothetical protein
MGPPLRREEGSHYYRSLPFYWRVTLLALSLSLAHSLTLSQIWSKLFQRFRLWNTWTDRISPNCIHFEHFLQIAQYELSPLLFCPVVLIYLRIQVDLIDFQAISTSHSPSSDVWIFAPRAHNLLSCYLSGTATIYHSTCHHVTHRIIPASRVHLSTLQSRFYTMAS